jgi:dihydropteroate synthase
MGVVNVTHDSFSGGERFLDRDRAVAHGLALVDQGCRSSMSVVSRPVPVPPP